MTQPFLFIVRTCPTGEHYRNNFATYWSFQRLLREKRSSLAALAENIQKADYEHPTDITATATVMRRIHLCLALNSADFMAASSETEEGQIIIRRLEELEIEAISEPIPEKSKKVA